MRVTDHEIGQGEKFAFEVEDARPQLVVNREALPESYPRHRSLGGLSVVAEVMYPAGMGELVAGDELDWDQAYLFRANNRIRAFSTYDTRYPLVYDRDEDLQVRRDASLVAEHILGENDKVILRGSGQIFGSVTAIVDATAQLPASPTKYNPHHGPIGIINHEDTLITWGERAGVGERLDLVIAKHLAETPEEKGSVRRRLGVRSLRGSLVSCPALEAYLEYFDETHGQSFMPEDDR